MGTGRGRVSRKCIRRRLFLILICRKNLIYLISKSIELKLKLLLRRLSSIDFDCLINELLGPLRIHFSRKKYFSLKIHDFRDSPRFCRFLWEISTFDWQNPNEFRYFSTFPPPPIYEISLKKFSPTSQNNIPLERLTSALCHTKLYY